MPAGGLAGGGRLCGLRGLTWGRRWKVTRRSWGDGKQRERGHGVDRSENQPRAVSRACSLRPFIRGVSINSSRLPASERHTGAARTKSHCPRVLSSLAEPRELSGERAGV